MNWFDNIKKERTLGKTHGFGVDSNIIRKILKDLGFPERGKDGLVSGEHWDIDSMWDIVYDEDDFKVSLNLKEEGSPQYPKNASNYILEAIPKGEMELIRKSYDSDDVKIVKVFKNFKMKEATKIPIGEQFKIEWNIVDFENGVLVLSISKAEGHW